MAATAKLHAEQRVVISGRSKRGTVGGIGTRGFAWNIHQSLCYSYNTVICATRHDGC